MKKTLLGITLAAAMAASGTAVFAEEEITEIYMQWPSLGSTGSGFQAVEDALNELLETDIGVHVILEPVSYAELLNDTTLTVTSGEQLDLCLEIGTGVAPYVSNGLILPLTDLVQEYGQGILEACGDTIYSGYYQNELYAIPVAYISGDAYGYVARQDILDKYGITIDDEKYYTPEELEEIFAVVKEGEGEKFYMAIPGNSYQPMDGAWMEMDSLSATPASGVLMLCRGFDQTTVTNLYETEEFETYAKTMYDWAQKGYYSADAATTTEDGTVLFQTGNYLGVFAQNTPARILELESQYGYDMTPIRMIAGYKQTSSTVVSWQIPITTASAEKAMETLNYIYANPEAATILQYGLEGQDYQVVESTEEGTVIEFLGDAASLPYYQPFTVYGDRLSWPVVAPAPIDLNQQSREWDAAIPEERVSTTLGYCFDMESVSTEYSAVYAVLNQYLTTINCGALDPEVVLPEFQSALESAGIDTVIAENQRQLDAWLAEQ
ncbi:MAG: ABC transporter substrate-binding protein [Eubacteriales bacterium]|nr:ABC transporter substrate-binding protein [Eubacteriales bacterium]